MRKSGSMWLIAIGVLHTVLGLVWAVGSPAVREEILRSGIVDAVNPHSPRTTLYFWFLMCGFCMILVGQVGFWAERALRRPLPAFVGWELLALAVFGAVLDPDSGWWLILALATYILVNSRRATGASQTGRAGEDRR